MAVIQIRHVPDDLHRRLKARAAMAGMSLSDYALVVLRRVVERPTRTELQAGIGQRARRVYEVSPTVRAERDLK